MDLTQHINFCRNLGIAVGIGMSGAGTGQFVISPLLQLAIENVGLAQEKHT